MNEEIEVQISALNPDGTYRDVGTYAGAIVSSLKLRERIDTDEWQAGIGVLDDMQIQIFTGDMSISNAARAASQFAYGVREFARVVVRRKGEIIFVGFIKDADSKWDIDTRTEKLSVISPATILRDEVVFPNALSAGMAWTTAVRVILGSQPFAVNFDAQRGFDELRSAAEPPLNFDTLRIGDPSFFSGRSLLDSLRSLLGPIFGVALFEPPQDPDTDAAANVRLLPRNAVSTTDIISLTEDTAQNMVMSSGAARAVKAAEVSYVGGRAVAAHAGLGSGSIVRLETDWLGSEFEARRVAQYILDREVVPRQEVEVTWHADAAPHFPRLLGQVRLNFGDGDMLDERVSVDGARLSSDDAIASLSGLYRVYDIQADLANDTIRATIKN